MDMRDSGTESAVWVGGVVVVAGLSVAGAQASDKTAPILAFIGAVLVAVIAATTAGKRLRDQLRHDREMHDLADLRELLTLALVTLHKAFDLTVEKYRPAVAAESHDAYVQRVTAADEGFASEVDVASLVTVRLRLALTDSSAFLAAFGRVTDILGPVGAAGEITAEQQKTVTRLITEAEAEGYKLVGNRVPPADVEAAASTHP